MSKLKQHLIGLNADDRKALKRMADDTDANMSEVIRWAIRWYLLRGPWRLDDPEERKKALKLRKPLIVGPKHGETV